MSICERRKDTETWGFLCPYPPPWSGVKDNVLTVEMSASCMLSWSNPKPNQGRPKQLKNARELPVCNACVYVCECVSKHTCMRKKGGRERRDKSHRNKRGRVVIHLSRAR